MRCQIVLAKYNLIIYYKFSDTILLSLLEPSLLYPIIYKYPEISTKIGIEFLIKYSTCPEVITTAIDCKDITISSDVIDILLEHTSVSGAKDLFYYIIKRYQNDPSPYINILNMFENNIVYKHTLLTSSKTSTYYT